jgi:hypothetical protein
MVLSGDSSSQNECKWVVVTRVISIVAWGQEKWAVYHSLPLNVRPFSYRHYYFSTQLFWLLDGCCSRKIRVSRLTRNHLSKMVQKLMNYFRVTWQALEASFGASWEAPLAHIRSSEVFLCTFHQCLVDSGDGPCGQHGLETWLVPDLNKMWKWTSLLLLKSLLVSSDVPPLLAHDHDCRNFCSFLLWNLTKSSYRWSPLQLHHTIEKKKTLFLMKSCTEHYIVTDVVPSDEGQGCPPQLM